MQINVKDKKEILFNYFYKHALYFIITAFLDEFFFPRFTLNILFDKTLRQTTFLKQQERFSNKKCFSI